MNVAQHDANGSDPAVPLYHQLALRLESAIQSGAIVPGQELGNEIRLAVRFGVSRPTMRRAILELVDKGLLVRKRGVGTHVVNSLSTDRRANDPRISRELRLSSLFDDLTAQGQQPTTVVLTQEMIRPPQATPGGLSGSRCKYIEGKARELFSTSRSSGLDILRGLEKVSDLR